jgi:biotin carboxylase
MVKPCDGSGSRGASRVDEPEKLKEACHYAMDGSLTHCAEIESFIVGKEYGAESLVIDGEIHVLAIMKKWMTDSPYYAELGHAIPCGLPVEIEARAKACVKKAIEVLGVNHGSVNMDIIITEEGRIHIIDIGARMGGNMIGPCVIPYGTGIDYIGNMLKAAVGEQLDWTVKPHSAVATKLLALNPGTVKELPDFSLLDYVDVEHHLHVGDVIQEYHTNLDGCGYVIATGLDVESSENKAEEARAWIDKNIVRF